jgi:conjugative relaxase-like TrwC/TraI family protein
MALMVASITTLTSPLAGDYFTSLAKPDYYLAGGEPPGRWRGEGAIALGLEDLVDQESFKNILAGLSAEGRELDRRLRAGANEKRVPGYDLTFSAPKSVSALWATAPPEIQRQIEIAFDVAVNSTLTWLEKNVPLARRGKGGYRREFAELVIAQFAHGTSRVAKGKGFEPQLHCHNVIANVCGQDGRWSGVNSRVLHEWTRSLGPMFRATLAGELQQRLGVGVIRPLDSRGQEASWFEVAGVPAELCRQWSSRRDEIERLLEGSTGLGAAWSRAQARETANLASRTTKTDIPPRQKLFSLWREAARRLGFSPETVLGINGSRSEIDPETFFAAAWRMTTDELDQSQSTFTYREAVQRVCEAAQTSGLAGTWLADRVAQQLRQSEEIRLIGEVNGDIRYATQATWREEEAFIAEVDRLRSATGACVSPKDIAKAIASHPTLLPEQRAAAEHLLQLPGAIRALTGVAGAGKSFTLDVVREALERGGYKVIGAALAGVAKEELAAKAGIESRTIASYLHHFNKSLGQKLRERVRHDVRQLVRAIQGKSTYLPTKVTIDRKTVLIVDEAGMIDTKSFRRLCQEVRRRGGTVIFIGDTAQLQPIAAGGPFRYLLKQLTPASLQTNLRQRDRADLLATEQFRAGGARPALQNYAERGRLVVAKDRGEAIHQLVDAWTAGGGAKQPEKHVIFTPTRSEAQVANRFCQAERIEQGAIDRSRALRHGDDLLCAGDRVLFHKNVFADGIRNGYRGVITGVDRLRGRLTIRLDGEGNERDVTVRARDYGVAGLTLGYAQTTHKGQGQTVDHSYLLVGGKMADREMIYVQATRGKLSTQLFVDEPHAGEELQELARTLARSRPKELAHEIAARRAESRRLTLEQ